MAVRTADARWEGDLLNGTGNVKLGSGLLQAEYSFPSRFKEGAGTNPEELIAAAHAGCFSMALSAGLAKDGHTPDSVETTASVYLEPVGDGFEITRIHLNCSAVVPGIDEQTFQEYANGAKLNCPVSKALASVNVTLEASLMASAATG